MKITKKVLSVLLAVIMIMSSMSVCFGSISFAATSATNDFIKAVQCDAMKNFSATHSYASNTNTYTVTAANYVQFMELVNVIKTFDSAVQSISEYTNKHDHITDTNCSASSTQCTDFGALKTALISDMTSTTYNSLVNQGYKVDAFLNCVLSMTNVTYARSLNKYHTSTGWSYTAKAPEKFFNVLNVSVDYLTYFTTKTDTDEITEDEIYTSYKYTTAMGRQLYTKSASWGRTTYYGHSCVNTEQIGYFSKHEEGTKTATNRAALQTMKSVLESNKDYLDETTIAGVHKVSTNPTTLNNAATAIEDAYEAVKTAFGTNAETIFNHFFKENYITYGTTVDTLVALIKKAATIAGYKSACETIAKDYAIYENETYKTYTSTEVNALYNELKTAYEGYKAADDSLEAEIAKYYGIDGYIDDIPDVLEALLAYYYEIFLGSIKERAIDGVDGEAGYVNRYQNWTVEDIDNDVLTSADILTAMNEVTLDIDTLEADATDDDIQSYFGVTKSELIDTLTAVKTHLENLGYYAGLNDDLYDQYKTFTNNIAKVINADSSKLYSVLSSYEQWHKDLQNFFTTWSTEVGEYKDLLEDDLQATMNTYMQEAYTALKARVVTQIDNAYGLYEVYYDIYGNNVTMASLTYFNSLKKAIDAIEHNAYKWMLKAHYTYGTAIDDVSIAKYDALQVIYNAYGTFVKNRGFDTYTQTTVDTVREDTDKDIARENADTDFDGIGEYEVADEDIEAIIDLLEAALKDEEIKKLLGNLINKDEDGNPTGEAFELGELINGLLEDNLYTDNLINTIISFLYPIVAKAFLDVWVGIDPIIDTTADTDMGTLPVHAKLKLYDVDTAIEAAGVALAPVNLGNFMAKNSNYAAKYPEVIKILRSVTDQTRYNADGSFADPWQSSTLYEDAVDEDGNVIIDEETGEAKQVMKLDWGIDEAEDKRAAFIDAACAALCGVEPLLKALLLNQSFVSPNIENNKQRGGKIGTSVDGTTVEAFGLTLDLTLDPITLMLDMSANDGYDNVLAPLFELLGLENIPHSEDMTSVRDLLEDGLFAMIDQLIDKLNANPIKTILDLIPNLVYALEADLIAPVLNFLETNIYYEADTHYSANAWVTSVTGDLAGVMKADKPAYINVGEMLNLESLGINLSDGLAGILDMIGIDIPVPDVSVLATAGELVWKNTNRSRWTYSYQPSGVSDKAAHIEANRADVLEYLLKYVLGNLDELLAAFGVDTSSMGELVSTILTNVSSNADASLAAVVELLNQEIYDTLENYEWFDADSYSRPTADGFTPATQIYMTPDNDWTEEKAEYLYNNLEAIVTAVLSMAKLDLDKTTEEVDGSIEEVIAGLIDGLLTNETLTALAKLLANLDLNTTLNKDKTEEEKAAAIDVNGLIDHILGIDLSAYSVYTTLAENEVYDFGVTDAESFVTALVSLLEPLSPVLDFILEGGDITITLGDETVELLGYDGYNNALIPLLEALGCDVKALTDSDNALEVVLNTLLAKIDELTTNTDEDTTDGAIYGIIDMLPGILYFLSSNGVSTAVRNLLQPVYVILDTIRPVYDLDLNELLAGIEINGKSLGLDLNNINTEFVIGLVCDLTGLNLSGLNTIIYDVCAFIGVEYISASTFQSDWKKGEYTDEFSESDLLTVVLSYLLEWVTVEDNAEALDDMLGTDGIVAAIDEVFADVEITYGTPDWYYWFESEEAFNDYIAGDEELPNTLLALEYPNDWSEESAEYIADNLADLVDQVIGLLEINDNKYASVSALLNDLVYGDFGLTIGEGEDAVTINYLFSDETINTLIGILKDILANVDDTLLGAGYILDVDLVGLKNYTCTEEITTIDAFVAELAYVLDTYAKGLVDLLLFGDDFRLAKKSNNTDTIVINGGLGYEKGLALILEALGCDVPAAEEATVYNILGCLADRVEEILAAPVNEVVDMLPNLVYFLNANGAGVAIDNLLQSVYAIIDKVNALGILEDEIDLADMLGFDLKYLSLEDILTLVTDKTGLDLEAAEEILVDLCIGKIEKAQYTYKMTADRKDTVTVVLTTALLLVSDDEFAAKLDELLGTEIVAALKTVFESAPVAYATPDWDYCWAEDGIDYDNATVEVVEHAITYPNNWTEESAIYLSDNLPAIGDMIAGLIDSNYSTLSGLLNAKVNIYTPEILEALQKVIADLIGGLDEELKDIVNVALGAADKLLGADVQGLLDYDVSSVKDKETFVAALTGMLMEVEGLVDWLLLGEDYEFFVDDDGDMAYDSSEAIITLNGGHGYAEGLALLLEALGCENLPTVYDNEAIDTEATVKAVLTSVANRIDEIFANPVEEIVELLPNIFYFLNTNGVAIVVDNLIGAIDALLIKLEGLGLEVDINELVNIKKLLKLEDTDAKISLDNLTMAAILEAVSLMVGLDLTAVENVLVGFALGEVKAYESVSRTNVTYKMEYKDDFDKHDLITTVVTIALITLADEVNAEKIKEFVGEEIYQVILNLLNMSEVPVQEFSWKLTENADTGYVFSALSTSELYAGHQYGPNYTEEMAEYIADNFGEFVDNIIYLLGIQINGKNVDTLKDLINGLLDGSLYNSSNVIAIRDALAGVIANIDNLEVNGAKVGGHIKAILKTSGVADLDAVAKVNVPEFTEDRAKFTEYLCDVLEPLYAVLKYILADEDISFFVNAEKTDAITLKGAEGYAYGIIPLLELLECQGILSPAEYYAAVEADGDVLLTSILTPLLDRVDEILADDPAQEILDMLPNLIYFINSNGVDTVVKNTLNAVYALLGAIEPVAKLDIYELIGIDLATIDFDWLFDKLLEIVANSTGYEFEALDASAIAELTVGTLESYTSLNGKTAYKMVYAEGAEVGNKPEMVTVVMRLLVTFIMHENNQNMLLGLLRDNLGMTADAEKYVAALLKVIADCAVETRLGMDSALATLYYIFYGADIGVGNTATGMKDLNAEWTKLLDEMRNSSDKGEAAAGDIIAGILDLDIFEDIIDPDEGIAPNGFIKFFQKIAEWFKSIAAWFKNLFS